MLTILESRRNQIDELHRRLIRSIQTQEEDDVYTVLDRTSIQHPVSAVVLNFLMDKPIECVARVYLTQVIKQELLTRTLPRYKPLTLQQQLTSILDVDVCSLSTKQAKYLFDRLTSDYNRVEVEVFDYEDNDHYYDDYGFYSLIDRVYSFDLLVMRFQFASRIKNVHFHQTNVR
jgi:hypothetical protein